MPNNRQISFKTEGLANKLNLSTVILSKICASGITLELRQPLVIEPQLLEQEFILKWPAFNIIASGATREEAINTFEEDFVWLWKEYGKYDDNKLSPDALQLKKDLLALA